MHDTYEWLQSPHEASTIFISVFTGEETAQSVQITCPRSQQVMELGFEPALRGSRFLALNLYNAKTGDRVSEDMHRTPDA